MPDESVHGDAPAVNPRWRHIPYLGEVSSPEELVLRLIDAHRAARAAAEHGLTLTDRFTVTDHEST
jgi:hypothetical protein